MFGGRILAPEPASFAELLAAGWTPEDLDWENQAETALACLAADDPPRAEESFARMVRIANTAFAADDPRLGTSLANQGAALVASGQAGLSGLSVRDARRIWQDADAWIFGMTAPRVARSSLFHMRMEQRHRAAYEERWRLKWAALAGEARRLVGRAGPLQLVSKSEADARLARWRRERPAMFNDTRKLIAAVLLLACNPSPDEQAC
jgi:hypothetical protein